MTLRRAPLLALVALGVLPVNATRAVAPQAACGKLLPPESGIYFGAAPDFVSDPKRLEGDTVTTEAIRQFDDEAGRRAVWSEFDQHWFEGLDFPWQKVLTAWRAGKIPFVRMWPHAGSPFGVGNPPEQYPGAYALQNIIDGMFDPQLKAWADTARDSNIPILAEFGTEANASEPWTGKWNGGGETTGYGDPTLPDGPERFRDAYRHIVTLFRAEGATNVTWFFHVVQQFMPEPPWNTFSNLYPGDDYVDWLALSTYGLPNLPDGSIMSFEQALQTFHDPAYPGTYADLASLGSKPLALVEVGVSEYPMKPDWIRGMFSTLASGRYPRIAGIAWWQSTDVATRFDTSAAALQAFHDGAQSPLFDAKPRFSGTCTPAAPSGTRVVRHGKTVTISWLPLADATSYEVWRGSARLGATTSTRFAVRAPRRSSYRIRALDSLGPGPFAASVRG
jgi:glycosyl hydrolase family 26